MFYWKIIYENGKVEYWQSKKSTYNFKQMFKTTPRIEKAEPITRLVYLWYKRKQPSFTITLE